jgi:hypothetical protein
MSFYGYIFISTLLTLGAIIAVIKQEWFSVTIFTLMVVMSLLFFKSIKKQYLEEVKNFKKQLEAE